MERGKGGRDGEGTKQVNRSSRNLTYDTGWEPVLAEGGVRLL